MKKNHISHISGTGKLTSNTTLEVKNGKMTEIIEAHKIIFSILKEEMKDKIHALEIEIK